MLKKMRKDNAIADYKIIMVNHDAVPKGYSPRVEDGVYFVIVNVGESTAEVLPPR